jgi:hypothetical protein
MRRQRQSPSNAPGASRRDGMFRAPPRRNPDAPSHREIHAARTLGRRTAPSSAASTTSSSVVQWLSATAMSYIPASRSREWAISSSLRRSSRFWRTASSKVVTRRSRICSRSDVMTNSRSMNWTVTPAWTRPLVRLRRVASNTPRRSKRCSAVYGLVRKLSAPASNPRMMSRGSARLVRRITGRSGCSRLTRRHSSYPSTLPGMTTSLTTTS